MLLEEGEEDEQSTSYGEKPSEGGANMEGATIAGGVEVTVSTTPGTDLQYELPSGDKALTQNTGVVSVGDVGMEPGFCLNPVGSGKSGINSAPATPEALRQDRGILIQSSPLASISILSESTGSKEGTMLPWGAHKERSSYPTCVNVDINIRPGEYVMRTLFAEFTIQAEKKIESVMAEPPERLLSKALQRGEDSMFDQLLSAFGSVAEHCLPSILRALFAWYERQMGVLDPVSTEQKKSDQKGKSSDSTDRSEADLQQERRDLAVEFIFCLMLIEVLRQLPFHPGHEDLVRYIEDIAFKHFKHREGSQSSPNAANIHIVADLYAEVIGALAQSRFSSVRKRFMAELKELRTKEPSPNPTHSLTTTHSIIALLMGMKFFRVKMVPIEEFEASFQFMQECAQYFLEVKDKDVKHALAGLFVEILVPVAATVKNEVNVPCLKNFVEMLYAQTLDMCTKNKHRLPLFPMVTCLLCVSQKQFFLQNWHYFLAMCLSHLKNKDPKMCRVALEALYRLLWVYMIRIKCESNSATQSRLQSIVNSLFPKGSKAVVPRDTPLNIFVKIIQFIAQERLDFAMREIVFDLLSVGRPIKIILTPERMSIGLRAFLVVADSLQQKEGEPPMPRTVGVMPSGNTLRVKKTFLNKMLTEDTARSIGMSAYFPHVRRVFVDILRALDVHYGRPLMLTNVQNVNKESHATSNPSFSSYFLRQEPDELITGERKPRIDLFRTCVAAVPRLIPDGITGAELVDLLARLTVHMDEELRALAYQSLQTLVIDFPDWRQDVICGFTQFLARDMQDTFPQLLDNGLRMLLQLLTSWKNALVVPGTTTLRTSTVHSSQPVPTHPPSAASSDRGSERSTISDRSTASEREYHIPQPKKLQDAVQKVEAVGSVLHMVEALALVMLCHCRLYPRRLSVHILREVKHLLKLVGSAGHDQPVIDVIDKCCPIVFEKCLSILPPAEKSAALAISSVDLQWIADRSSSVWTAGFQDENSTKSSSQLNLAGVDPWTTCLFGFLERDRVLSCCPTAVIHSWPIVFSRINSLFTVIDPTPVSDNRASLLRSSVTVRKPVNERDIYMHVWKTYVAFAFRVVPPIPSPVVRCASPDLSLSSSPDSLTNERGDNKSPASSQVSPTGLYKLVVPLLRCEAADVRDAAVQALGRVNVDALKDLLEEFVLYIREAVDRKQENMRRRRRRDALRLQVVRVFELIAEHGTFGTSSCVLERDTQSLHPTIVEYIEGARLYLESEPDKDLPSTVKLHFCNFIRKMIKSFSLETCHTLLKRDLRRNLFTLFAGWTGRFGRSLGVGHDSTEESGSCTELQLSALQAMSALVCCGPCFNPDALSEDGALYPWLDMLLSSQDEKVYQLARETVVLLLECNPDVGPLLDWVVDRCYTGSPGVADSCFLALAAVFSAREYPCDHYTAVINVTLMNTGCPRTLVHETALQLLQVLDKRFFGSVGPLATDGEAVSVNRRRSIDIQNSFRIEHFRLVASRQTGTMSISALTPLRAAHGFGEPLNASASMASNGVEPPATELQTFVPQDGSEKRGSSFNHGKYQVTNGTLDAEAAELLNGKDFDPFKARSVEQPTTNCDTLTHLLKASLGSGILSMPLAFKYSGLAMGIVYTIIVAIICTHCAYILVKCAHALYYRTRTSAMSFADVGEMSCREGPEWVKKYSKAMRVVILGSLFATYFGTCSVYTVIIAKNFRAVVEVYVEEKVEIRVYIAALLIPLILLGLVPNLKYLAPVSMVANGFMGIGLGITMYYLCINLKPIEELEMSNHVANIPPFLCLVIFAMEAIGVVMPLENNMKTPKNFLGLGGVLNQGMAGVTLVYILLGFLGYMAYGEKTEDVITFNLPDKDVAAQVVKVFIGLAVFCTYGLQWFVCLEIIWDGLKERYQKKALLAEYIVRVLLVTATVLLAVAVPTIGPFIGLIGALCFSILGIILPCFIECITFWEDGLGPGKWRLWKNVIISIFGVIVLIFGTKDSVIDIMKTYSPSNNLNSTASAILNGTLAPENLSTPISS